MRKLPQGTLVQVTGFDDELFPLVDAMDSKLAASMLESFGAIVFLSLHLFYSACEFLEDVKS